MRTAVAGALGVLAGAACVLALWVRDLGSGVEQEAIRLVAVRRIEREEES